MRRAGARFWLALPLLAALALAGLAPAALTHAAPTRQGGTAVTVSPAQSNLACDATASVDIRITNVTNLFGVDIKIAYDPNVVSVVDADPNAAGLTITPGDLPEVAGGAGLIQVNSVDEGAGIIGYAAIRLNPAPAQSGSGVIANITFKGKAAGTSDISLESVTLADDTARPIPADLTSGKITVRCDGEPVPTETTAPGRPTATRPPGRPTPTATRPAGGKPVGGGDRTCDHIVKPGETLYSIARYHGVSVAALSAANGIANPNFIYAGQKLVVPGCGGTGRPPVPGKPSDPGPGKNPGGSCSTHVVKPGETLFGIAYMYGDSVAAISQRNGIANPNLVWAGQGLTVCGGGYTPPGPPPGSGSGWGKPMPGKPGMGGACRYTHIVKPGETLFSIAWRYGSSVYAVQSASGLANPNLIYAGQALCIP